MYVYFDPDTLRPQHFITVHDPKYDPSSNGEHFVECDETRDLARIMLTKAADGTVTVGMKRDMAVTQSAARIALGDTATFDGVPANAAIAINGASGGTMDADGRLELLPASKGFFAVVFILAGFMDWEGSLEVVAQR